MSYPENPHNPRSYGQMFLVLSHVAAASLLLILIAAAGVMTDTFMLIGFCVATLAVIVMYTTRNADEWVAGLWSAGANAGFVGAMAWLVLGPFVEGFYDGLIGNESEQDLPASAASVVALACFLIAFNLKRIRGV